MWDPVFDTGAASSACPYGSDCSDCTAYVAATPTSAGYFPTRCGQAAPPARTATSVAAEIATDVKLEANFDAIFDSDDRRRLAAATSVASPDRNPDRPADRPADRPTARRLLKAGASAYDYSHSSADYGMRGGRPATYGTGRWGSAASSVRRRAPVYSGAGAGVHFTGGVSSAPYYYGRRSVRHDTNLLVLTSSHFHHHYGYHDCGGVTYDRFACKQTTSYRTPDDLDRYELTEALALPPIPRSGRWRQDPNPQWPLELTVHELLLYPPHATEGRAPPALLGFSTNDVSRLSQASQFCRFLLVSSLCSYLLCCVFLPLCFERPSYVSKERRKRCAPSLASKPGSTMV